MLYALMIALVIVILALAFSYPITQFTTSARDNVTGMDCDNSSISNFQKAACVATDLSGFYYIAGILFIGMALLGAKIVFGGQE